MWWTSSLWASGIPRWCIYVSFLIFELFQKIDLNLRHINDWAALGSRHNWVTLIIFSDENRLWLHIKVCRLRVRRRPGERHIPRYIRPRHTYPTWPHDIGWHLKPYYLLCLKRKRITVQCTPNLLSPHSTDITAKGRRCAVQVGLCLPTWHLCYSTVSIRSSTESVVSPTVKYILHCTCIGHNITNRVIQSCPLQFLRYCLNRRENHRISQVCIPYLHYRICVRIQSFVNA